MSPAKKLQKLSILVGIRKDNGEAEVIEIGHDFSKLLVALENLDTKKYKTAGLAKQLQLWKSPKNYDIQAQVDEIPVIVEDEEEEVKPSKKK